MLSPALFCPATRERKRNSPFLFHTCVSTKLASSRVPRKLPTFIHDSPRTCVPCVSKRLSHMMCTSAGARAWSFLCLVAVVGGHLVSDISLVTPSVWQRRTNEHELCNVDVRVRVCVFSGRHGTAAVRVLLLGASKLLHNAHYPGSVRPVRFGTWDVPPFGNLGYSGAGNSWSAADRSGQLPLPTRDGGGE